LHLDQLFSLLGPGLGLILIAVWLVRKLARAARNERDLEENRLRGVLAEELALARARAKESMKRPALSAVPDEGAAETPSATAVATPIATAMRTPVGGALSGADVASARPEHLAALVALLAERSEALRLAGTPDARPVEIVWVRSTESHVAWCERSHPRNPAAASVREVICVAQVEGGKIIARSSFG
jgi:hypothetical protein